MRGCRTAPASTYAATASGWRMTCTRRSWRSSRIRGTSRSSARRNTSSKCSARNVISATYIEEYRPVAEDDDLKQDVPPPSDRSEVERIKESSNYLRGTI